MSDHRGADATVRRGGGVDVVALSGEIDLSNVEELLADVRAALGVQGAVVVDLSAVAYLDSAGIRLLDTLARELEPAGRPLRLVAPAGGIARELLDLTGFRRDLVEDDLAAALAAVPGDGTPGPAGA